MIADLSFAGPDSARVRTARFIPRPSIPLSAACLVANGIRETLRELFGERCELTIGEPVAIGPQAWATLSHDAYCFLTCGRQTDVVIVLRAGDARVLVQRAFGEADVRGAAALSALEVHAVERIAGRCAAAFDPLYAERRGASQRLVSTALPTCVAFFDIRVSAPIDIEIGIGIVRDLPEAGPAGTLPASVLGAVPIEVHAEFAAGSIDARALLGLAPGDVVVLDTQVGAAGSLKIADRYIARGSGGIVGGRYSFEVHTVDGTGARS